MHARAHTHTHTHTHWQSLTRSHSSVRDLAALAAQPTRRRKMFSEQEREEREADGEGEGEEDGEDTTVLGYWSNPEEQVKYNYMHGQNSMAFSHLSA